MNQPTCFACAPLRALHEQGRVPPTGDEAERLEFRIRKNRERPAAPPRTNIHQHTRDCRRDKAHRDSYARSHEGAK